MYGSGQRRALRPWDADVDQSHTIFEHPTASSTTQTKINHQYFNLENAKSQTYCCQQHSYIADSEIPILYSIFLRDTRHSFVISDRDRSTYIHLRPETYLRYHWGTEKHDRHHVSSWRPSKTSSIAIIPRRGGWSSSPRSAWSVEGLSRSRPDGLGQGGRPLVDLSELASEEDISTRLACAETEHISLDGYPPHDPGPPHCSSGCKRPRKP